MVYANMPASIDELHRNIEREIAAVAAVLCLKIVKNWVQRLGTSASVPVVAVKKNSSFIHNNGIERAFRRIKNFIDIQKRFNFI